ncbi:MAG: hypothetical protein DWP95_10430 [Proteobacteria bacterium]|nr:MAG: hypothetical protein DWP95_10430 [Pseudomonadota bacterium]
MTNHINSLDDLLQIDDREVIEFEVPAWNSKSVYLKPLSSEEAETVSVDFSGISEDKSKMVGMRTGLVRKCLVDSAGNLLIKTNEQAKQLGDKSSAALKQIFDKCMDMNGFNVKVEDAEKNS